MLREAHERLDGADRLLRLVGLLLVVRKRDGHGVQLRLLAVRVAVLQQALSLLPRDQVQGDVLGVLGGRPLDPAARLRPLLPPLLLCLAPRLFHGLDHALVAALRGHLVVHGLVRVARAALVPVVVAGADGPARGRHGGPRAGEGCGGGLELGRLAPALVGSGHRRHCRVVGLRHRGRVLAVHGGGLTVGADRDRPLARGLRARAAAARPGHAGCSSAAANACRCAVAVAVAVAVALRGVLVRVRASSGVGVRVGVRGRPARRRCGSSRLSAVRLGRGRRRLIWFRADPGPRPQHEQRRVGAGRNRRPVVSPQTQSCRRGLRTALTEGHRRRGRCRPPWEWRGACVCARSRAR
mmetsp:Transcript_4437/g.18860  ORF Transcript_4437/g.18860 Transcript_4437/m.18860 type:complete len:353 (-) Transcript_4437:673-1731(-)